MPRSMAQRLHRRGVAADSLGDLLVGGQVLGLDQVGEAPRGVDRVEVLADQVLDQGCRLRSLYRTDHDGGLPSGRPAWPRSAAARRGSPCSPGRLWLGRQSEQSPSHPGDAQRRRRGPCSRSPAGRPFGIPEAPTLEPDAHHAMSTRRSAIHSTSPACLRSQSRSGLECGRCGRSSKTGRRNRCLREMSRGMKRVENSPF